MGHIQDRWFRRVVHPDTGAVRRERTELFGVGLRYKVRYLDPDGEEKSRSFADRQKKLAEEFLIETESDKREGKYVDHRAARKKFRQQAENWIKGQSTDAATREALRSRLKSQIYGHFGGMPLGMIRPATVRDWLGLLDEKGLSENYKLVLFTVVSGVLDSAVEDKIIRDNPCKAKTIRRPTGGSPTVTVWPEDRVHAVRAGLLDRFSLVVPLGCGLGLRQGEILSLSVDDLDPVAMVVRVQRQLRIVDGTVVFAPPKGGKARTVPASPGIIAEIREHEARCRLRPSPSPGASRGVNQSPHDC